MASIEALAYLLVYKNNMLLLITCISLLFNLLCIPIKLVNILSIRRGSTWHYHFVAKHRCIYFNP